MYPLGGKRLADLVISTLLLIILWPLLLLIGTVVRIKLGSPVIFRQERGGVGGSVFSIIKFRTMTDESDATGRLLPDECRTTKLGAVLRSSSLDEIPSLVNVALGQMSLVGPRPLPARYNSRFSSFQQRRLDVRPGITGWAQVNGRNSATWEERFAMDVAYAENVSVLFDLKIVGRTIGTVLRRENIDPDAGGAMPEFGLS